jgi:hypothetical protein
MQVSTKFQLKKTEQQANQIGNHLLNMHGIQYTYQLNWQNVGHATWQPELPIYWLLSVSYYLSDEA